MTAKRVARLMALGFDWGGEQVSVICQLLDVFKAFVDTPNRYTKHKISIRMVTVFFVEHISLHV